MRHDRDHIAGRDGLGFTLRNRDVHGGHGLGLFGRQRRHEHETCDQQNHQQVEERHRQPQVRDVLDRTGAHTGMS
jgi:hypothetical protein